MGETIIVLDMAAPGSDMSMLVEMRDGVIRNICRVDIPPQRPQGTAAEIEHRLAEYMKTRGHMYERIRKAWPLRLPTVPCIKYGRRKPLRRVYGYTHIGLLTGKGWQAQNLKISIP